jgi:hypothetical protein
MSCWRGKSNGRSEGWSAKTPADSYARAGGHLEIEHLRSGRRPLLLYRAPAGRQTVAQGKRRAGARRAALGNPPPLSPLSPNTFSGLGERARVRGQNPGKASKAKCL